MPGKGIVIDPLNGTSINLGGIGSTSFGTSCLSKGGKQRGRERTKTPPTPLPIPTGGPRLPDGNDDGRDNEMLFQVQWNTNQGRAEGYFSEPAMAPRNTGGVT